MEVVGEDWGLGSDGCPPSSIQPQKICARRSRGVHRRYFIPSALSLATPQHPMPVPNVELTASWISRLTFTFMNPVISLGSKVAHISHDQLPPLSDADWASVQKRRAFQVLSLLPSGVLVQMRATECRPILGCQTQAYIFGLLKTYRTCACTF